VKYLITRGASVQLVDFQQRTLLEAAEGMEVDLKASAFAFEGEVGFGDESLLAEVQEIKNRNSYFLHVFLFFYYKFIKNTLHIISIIMIIN
jgi:hypothetical protein